jgi:glyoxylase-like metal-dependent hydrolase (beta-lactamase superfamily II)
VIAEELKGNVIHLGGHELVTVELDHTDTDHTTCLHAPSIGLVVAGDAAYNDVHLYLAESNAQKRQEWIAALDKIESLNPRAVVASHKRPENDDNPSIIEETRQYIRDFDRLAETTRTAQELYDKMLIETPAGFDYTGSDCRSWMKEAGFRETRVEHLAGPDSMVIGIR